MNSAPKISVIVASYNGERFVAETMRAILRQTLPDFELIVIDDGSTDGTRAILRELAAGDSRMRLIEKPNEGLIATLNRGIAETRGGYIARIDHDDVMRPMRLERQAAFLDSNPSFVAVGCLMQSMREDGSYIGAPRIRHEKMRHDPAAFPPKQQWLYGPTPMIRAEALRRAGGYREKFVTAEDRDLCWRLGRLGPMERLPEVLVDYRFHATNQSRLRQRTQVYSALLSDLSAIAQHFGLDDSAVVDSIVPGGDYAPAIAGYRQLIGERYPIDSYLMLYQMRAELWDLPGFPQRDGMLAAVARHFARKPWDPVRLLLLRKSALYLTRKPRGLGGHRAPGE
jgi:glycosyltransferase involved in cell wall biosynthesis